MTGTYILNGKEVVPFHGSLEEWYAWKDVTDTLVQQTEIEKIWICTRFGGYAFQADEANQGPLVFNTKIMDMQPHPYRYPRHFRRYTTWDEAVAGRAAAVDLVTNGVCQSNGWKVGPPKRRSSQ
jgi:hypothetical protein